MPDFYHLKTDEGQTSSKLTGNRYNIATDDKCPKSLRRKTCSFPFSWTMKCMELHKSKLFKFYEYIRQRYMIYGRVLSFRLLKNKIILVSVI